MFRNQVGAVTKKWIIRILREIKGLKKLTLTPVSFARYNKPSRSDLAFAAAFSASQIGFILALCSLMASSVALLALYLKKSGNELRFHVKSIKYLVNFIIASNSTMWKLRKFTLTHFWQIFREMNAFTKEKLLKSWFDEIFFGESKFWIYHTMWHFSTL